ncbi:MAG: siderophore-interacting protein [Thermomicrobiales bacterium]|nr:siderophore-interacting protein [Thermomicrobiales bacterium]
MTDSIQTAPLFRKVFTRYEKPAYQRFQVKGRQQITPRYVRVTLTSETFQGINFGAPDDDVRVAIPLDLDAQLGELSYQYEPEFKVIYPDDAPKYEIKAYTIRRYDPELNEIDLEVALHDKGHGDYWARNCQPGQTVLVAGTWGSFDYEGQMDHLVLFGDETALPAISHLIEKQTWAPAITVVAEVKNEEERLDFTPVEGVNLAVHWLYRRDAKPGKNDVLMNGLRELIPLHTNGLYWGMGESATMRGIRHYLGEELGVHKKALNLGGYWKREDDPEEWFYEARGDEE